MSRDVRSPSSAAGHESALAPAPAHQFVSLDQQHEVAHLGMWVFLASEVLFFGGLFTAYAVYRTWYPDAFAEGSRALLIQAGTLNTAVLITSSLTMALAVRASDAGQARAAVRCLLLTVVLGSLFLGVKAFEYHTEFVEHHLPGPMFTFRTGDVRGAQVFFSLYFVMTGLHAVHMILGLGILSATAWATARRGLVGSARHWIEMTGLYWHFVDVVWIFLFPLLYLTGRHVPS